MLGKKEKIHWTVHGLYLSSEEEVSHIKHKTHFWLFLKHLPPTDADIILSMLDIESLFTNITQEQGLESVGHFLDTKPTKLPSTSFFITWLLLLYIYIYIYWKIYRWCIFTLEGISCYVTGVYFVGLCFILNYSTKDINFLDIKVTKKDRYLSSVLQTCWSEYISSCWKFSF